MKKWKKFAAGLMLIAGLSPQTRAQFGAPAAPAVGAAGVAGAPVAAAPAAAPNNLFSFICLTPEQKLACKEKICNCALGQMLNNGLKPMSTFTGGIIPTLCPEVKASDLLKPADSAEGAAARAKADEAAAKARREAVRYLGTVDCHYWPEAQEALINALRGDRNECVRLEAALALNRGCCCTKITIKALVNSVSGSEEDGFPRETSERVRGTAHAALAHCLSCYTEVVPVVEPKGPKEPIPPKSGEPLPPPVIIPKGGGETPKSEAKPSGTPDRLPVNLGQQTTPVEYYKNVQAAPRQQVLEDGQRALNRPQSVLPQLAAQDPGPNSVMDIFQHAFGGSSSTPVPQGVVVQQTLPPPQAAPVKTVSTQPAMPDPLPLPSSQPVVPANIAPAVPVKTVAPVEKTSSVPPTASTTTPVAARPTPTAPVTASPATQTVPGLSSSTATPPAAPRTIQLVQATEKAPPTTEAPKAQANNGLNMTLPQVITLLRESPHAEYREWAADNLLTIDGWTHPDVMKALAEAARSDSSAAVRVKCVRALGEMRVGTMTSLSAIQAAKSDTDQRVRQEAERSLKLISSIAGAGLALPPSR